MTASKVATFTTATVLVHAVVVLLHAAAHAKLAVDMSSLQNTFIGSVIVAAPILAGVLVWTPYRRIGALLLAASMFAALIFGAYHHFLDPGIDNVARVPAHGWGAVFRLTAVLLAVVQGCGSIVGWWGARRSARTSAQAW